MLCQASEMRMGEDEEREIGKIKSGREEKEGPARWKCRHEK